MMSFIDVCGCAHLQTTDLFRTVYGTIGGVSTGFQGELLTTDVMNSITLHPIKTAPDFYRLDNFLQGRRILELRERQLELKTSVIEVMTESPSLFSGFLKKANSSFELDKAVTQSKRDFPVKRAEYVTNDFLDNWQLFSRLSDNPRRGLEGYWKRYLAETKRQLNAQIYDSWMSRKVKRTKPVQVKDIEYGYLRRHPLKGIEFTIQINKPAKQRFVLRSRYTGILFREETGEPLVPYAGRERSHIYQKLLDTFMARESEEHNSELVKNSQFYWSKPIAEKPINFVVPLKSRWPTFRRFMKNFEKVMLQEDPNEKFFTLAIVLFEDGESELIVDAEISGDSNAYKQSKLTRTLFRKLVDKYDTRVNKKTFRLIVKASDFSRSIGCETGAALYNEDELIFFIDVDMMFNSDFLLRVRSNTIYNKLVYYPIVYSEYDDSANIVDAIGTALNKRNDSSPASTRTEPEYDYGEDKGFWRQFGFGMLGAYLGDLRKVGGFNQTIIGWGYEDLDLYEKFVKHNMTIFRSVDIGEVHMFHKMECEEAKMNPDQMKMCTRSKASLVASQRRFAQLIWKNKNLLDILPPENSTLTLTM